MKLKRKNAYDVPLGFRWFPNSWKLDCFIWAAVLEQSWTYKGKAEKESNETWPTS